MSQIPHNLQAEEALLGAALLRQSIVGDLAGFVDCSDFYKPLHQLAWEQMITLHACGAQIDVVTVGMAFSDVSQRQALMECMNATPAVSQAKRYAEEIVEMSRRRRLLHFHSTMAQECYERSADDVLAMNDPHADRLIAKRDAETDGLFGLQDFIAQANTTENRGEWLLPHILRPRWRAIIVASEGLGKGTLMRYLGLNAAAGLDPWNPRVPITPRRVLYIDVENADSTIVHQIKIAHADLNYEVECEDRYFIWRRESGLNFRDRRVQAEMETVLQQVRPEIVFAGPLYKMFRRKGSDDMEQATIELLEVLDDFRTRFNFALVLEHHAPKGGPGYRDMNPFGSSALLRWPEFGLTLEPVGNPLPHETTMTLDIGRFRRDREPADWPQSITRGQLGQRCAWNPRFANGRNRQGFT